jgi:hypothetical protein
MPTQSINARLKNNVRLDEEAKSFFAATRCEETDFFQNFLKA